MGGSVRRQCGRVSAIHGLRSPRSQSNKCSTDLGRDCSNSTNQCSTDREKSLDVDKVKDLDRECFSLHLFITNKVEGDPSLGGVTNCARTNFEFEK